MTVDASVVVCTCGRPAALERLLNSIARQNTSLRYEVIVVNNLPGTELPIKTTFGQARWIDEWRRGLSFARNAGIRAASSPVVVLADDDLEVPPGWLEALVRPILRSEFDAVTGPTKPLKLESEAEFVFEAYGGHAHQSRRAAFNREWLNRRRLMLPIWRAGGLGNSAIRRSVFDDPKVGMMEERLGAGSLAGSAEDVYFFYLMLRGNYRILHEPAATVRHAHRENMAELERQLCDYRRGEVCFCLLAAGRHWDPRGLTHLFCWIPFWRAGLLARESLLRLRGKRRIPFRLMRKEILAYFSGPFALFASSRRAKALRRGHPPGTKERTPAIKA